MGHVLRGSRRRVPRASCAPVALATLLVLSPASHFLAQSPPDEVQGLALDGAGSLTWGPTSLADDYNVYQGLLSWSGFSEGAVCFGDEIAAPTFTLAGDPPSGEGFYYLVTAEGPGGEGSAGAGASGPRLLRGRCDAVMRSSILGRVAYGGDEWTRQRLAALGRQGLIDEQLAPESIDESDNTTLSARRQHFTPPETNFELLGLEIVEAVYSRRQLEHQATMFWVNHFNTDYRKSFMFFSAYPYTERAFQSAKLHHDARNAFRDLAFNGTFRDILEASALSPAMIVFLDTATNVTGAPNENFARELLELHSMGVGNGYTQQDIVELARVFTGWSVCKKRNNQAADPLAPCITLKNDGTPGNTAGAWVRNFDPSLHDSGQKVLYAGTPHEAVIMATSADPEAGIADVDLALDAIAAHPAAARFIASKLLQRFVTETPSQEMINGVIAVWNDPSNPRGAGDLREVLRAVLSRPELADPARSRGKIRTPFEQVTAVLRAARGKTDGLTAMRDYLTRMAEVPHENPVPTGYPELGGDWLDTNNLLDRQNFALDVTSRTDYAFGADVLGLLEDAGVSTAYVPDNSGAIVDFFAEILFGGAITPAERQIAVTYLTTDDAGNPSPYDGARIAQTLGFMMGWAQFMEQ